MFCCHQALFTKSEIMKKYKFNLEFKITAENRFEKNYYIQ